LADFAGQGSSLFTQAPASRRSRLAAIWQALAAIRQVPPLVPRFACVAFTRGMVGWYDKPQFGRLPLRAQVMPLRTQVKSTQVRNGMCQEYNGHSRVRHMRIVACHNRWLCDTFRFGLTFEAGTDPKESQVNCPGGGLLP